MRDNEKQSAIILSVIGIVPVVWLALLIAPSVKGGLPEILPSLMNVFNNPFHIEVCEDSVKTVLILLLCYGMGIGIYFSTQRNYRRREEHGSAKTLKSIQITLAARLEKFNLESLASLTSADELDLPSMGEKKVALFALIPDNDSSFNFLVSILYTQLFQQLFYAADHIHGGSLPIPVHFLMDEFANVSLPDDFDKILSVMRSRGVSVSIILQNLAQLKALFEKQWESIVGNCDEFLYLGGNEQSTHKYVSELLGKETIDTNTYGKSSGRSGNYSTNYQISGRELLTPDEVRMLDNQYAILFIRGERPIMDFKYDILKHPNVALTTDGKEKPYKHGEVTIPHSSISVLAIDPDEVEESNYGETTYELLSDEDFEVDNNF